LSIGVYKPSTAFELGAAIGGAAGLIYVVVFNVPTDQAVGIVVIAAVIGSVVVGLFLPSIIASVPYIGTLLSRL
jgi:hypothetical protein